MKCLFGKYNVCSELKSLVFPWTEAFVFGFEGRFKAFLFSIDRHLYLRYSNLVYFKIRHKLWILKIA